MSLKTDLEAVIADARVDADIMRAIVQGPATGDDSLVETDNGMVPTFARTVDQTLQELFMLSTDPLVLTPTLDTLAYGDGDVLFATTEIADAFPEAGGRIDLMSIRVVDRDNNGLALDLIFFTTNVSIGSANGAVSLTDDNASQILGIVPILASDYRTIGTGQKVASLTNVNLPLFADAAGTSLFVAGISRSTGTYTASGLRLQFGAL